MIQRPHTARALTGNSVVWGVYPFNRTSRLHEDKPCRPRPASATVRRAADERQHGAAVEQTRTVDACCGPDTDTSSSYSGVGHPLHSKRNPPTLKHRHLDSDYVPPHLLAK
eukprot:Sspe_Gene.104751::Locus_81806_Transcript_1_1_Confidence_1.000_Length_333::g.104751::m.104751